MPLFLIRNLVFCCFVLAPLGVQATCHRIQPTHEVWEQLLSRYVVAGQVDYSAWHKSKSDRKALQDYVKRLSELCPSEFKGMKKTTQLAFVLNLYNAAVIELVLQHFPVRSINDIRVASQGPFDLKWLQASWRGQDKISLNHLENGLIRPMFKDARIHFVLVCAAKSCPVLLAKPYRGPTVLKQLDKQTLDFFKDKRHVFYDQQANTLVVSKIFSWYEQDFVDEAGSLKHYLVRETKRATGQDVVLKAKISFYDYSWDLNQTP